MKHPERGHLCLVQHTQTRTNTELVAQKVSNCYLCSNIVHMCSYYVFGIVLSLQLINTHCIFHR